MAHRNYSISNKVKFDDRGFRKELRRIVCGSNLNYTYIQTITQSDSNKGVVDIYDINNIGVIVTDNSVSMVGDSGRRLNSIRLDMQKRTGVELKII